MVAISIIAVDTIMNTAQKEEEGHKLVAEAEKQASSKSGFFRSMFSTSASGKEDAAETFVKAANTFKLAKAWGHAGAAYEQAATVYQSMPDYQYEVASKYSDAGKAYKNVDAKKAISAFEKAVEAQADGGRFQQCGRLKKDIAELHEQGRDEKAALAAFSAAADFFDMDDSKTNANAMRIKIASLSALAGDYAEAVTLFETIAESALSNNLLKYGARDHLLRAGLCRLCLSDVVGAQRAVETYAGMDSSFSSSREGRLLESLVASVDEADVDVFTNHVYEYDSISKLDEWKTTILLKIKNTIKADELAEDLT